MQCCLSVCLFVFYWALGTSWLQLAKEGKKRHSAGSLDLRNVYVEEGKKKKKEQKSKRLDCLSSDDTVSE